MRAGIVIIVIILVSCSQRIKVPDNVLSPEKMEKVMFDLMQADEFLNLKRSDSVARDSFSQVNLYQSVFALHETNKEEFKRSLRFYEEHPKLMKTVLDSIQQSVTRTQEDVAPKKSELKAKKLLNKRIPPQ